MTDDHIYSLRLQCLRLVWNPEQTDQENFWRAEQAWNYIADGLQKTKPETTKSKFDKDLEMASKAVASALFKKDS